MRSVSTEFNNLMRADARRIYGKIEVSYTDPHLDQSIEVTANESANISYASQTADNIETPTRKFASLDGSWDISADYELYRPGDQIGWWGKQLSGTGGVFSAPYPSLTATFAGRPVRTLKVAGDSRREEYPVDFLVRLYNSANDELYTETVIGNTLVKWNKDITQVNEVSKIVLEISRWSHAGRQAKVVEFITSIQEIYEGDDIFSISLIEEKDVSQGSLPVGNISSNEISIKLSNEDRKFDAGNTQSSLHQLVRPNRRIRAWIGTESELVPLGLFWSSDWTVPEDDVYAHTIGRDRLDMLRKTSYTTATVQINKSLYDLAVDVFTDAGLIVGEYWIDDELRNTIVPYAYFDIQSHREALRKIAEAGLGQAYCDREGTVRVEGASHMDNVVKSNIGTYFLGGAFPAESDSEIVNTYGISADNYFRKDNPAKISEIANRIEVETQPLVPEPMREVYRSNDTITLTGTKAYTIFFNETPCIDATASLDGTGTIEKATYYAWGANIVVSNGTFQLIVNARPLKIMNKEKAVTEDASSIYENGLMTYKYPGNPLVQTLDVARNIADKLLQYYKLPRRDLELDWRGNPALELNDIIMVPDYQRGGNDVRGYYYITRQELEYDGGLRMKTSGRRAL